MAETKGILGRKVGMTQIFDEAGRAIPVTVVQAGPCRVTQVKTPERDGYSAIQLAFGNAKRTNKPLGGHLAKAGVESAQHIVELRLDDASGYSVGDEVTAEVFAEGEIVDVVGVTKGKGFAGGMKRHNFKGLSASHGVEKVHRSPGSVGGASTPARVFKGKRMAGQLGHARVTTLNLQIIKADAERGLLLIKGAVPGPKDGLLMVRSAVRVRQRDTGRKAS